MRYIAFNQGSAQLAATEDLLQRAGLAGAAGLHRDGVLAGYCAIELPSTDARLAALIHELDALQVDYTMRADRKYDARDLDRFPWLVLRCTTAGLMGGVNLEQPYDFANACPTCGAGATPVPPLLADTARMGKKAIDCTAHDGHHIVTAALARAIEDAGLTGCAFSPVSRSARKEPDTAFRWIRITADWPKLSPLTALEKEDLCSACGRAGHYDAHSRVTEYWSDSYPESAADFNWTWEYFGRWRMNAQDQKRHVGGMRRPVVSQRVRTLFETLEVRHISFDPVFTRAAASFASR